GLSDVRVAAGKVNRLPTVQVAGRALGGRMAHVVADITCVLPWGRVETAICASGKRWYATPIVQAALSVRAARHGRDAALL
ncbi:MAG TPA: hypothetical protein VFU48_08700, partial [Nitrospira sp.]|nr:hypothetical protein [Nitrospira sp.]